MLKDLTELAFEAEFAPLCDADGSWIQFEPDMPGWREAAREQRLWTVVTGDFGGMYLVEGNRIVDRLYNIITEYPWRDSTEYQVTLCDPEEFEDEAEEDEESDDTTFPVGKWLWRSQDGCARVGLDRRGGVRFWYAVPSVGSCQFSLWSEVGEPYKALFAGFWDTFQLQEGVVEYAAAPWIANRVTARE